MSLFQNACSENKVVLSFSKDFSSHNALGYVSLGINYIYRMFHTFPLVSGAWDSCKMILLVVTG